MRRISTRSIFASSYRSSSKSRRSVISSRSSLHAAAQRHEVVLASDQVAHLLDFVSQSHSLRMEARISFLQSLFFLFAPHLRLVSNVHLGLLVVLERTVRCTYSSIASGHILGGLLLPQRLHVLRLRNTSTFLTLSVRFISSTRALCRSLLRLHVHLPRGLSILAIDKRFLITGSLFIVVGLGVHCGDLQHFATRWYSGCKVSFFRSVS